MHKCKSFNQTFWQFQEQNKINILSQKGLKTWAHHAQLFSLANVKCKNLNLIYSGHALSLALSIS